MTLYLRSLFAMRLLFSLRTFEVIKFFNLSSINEDLSSRRNVGFIMVKSGEPGSREGLSKNC